MVTYLIEFPHANQAVLKLFHGPERTDPQLYVGYFDECLRRSIVLTHDVLASERLSNQPHRLISLIKIRFIICRCCQHKYLLQIGAITK